MLPTTTDFKSNQDNYAEKARQRSIACLLLLVPRIIVILIY